MSSDYIMSLFAGKALTNEQTDEMKNDLRYINEEIEEIKAEEDEIALSRLFPVDLTKICNIKNFEKALRFAEEKHAGQKRKNGDAYIFHPVRVATMLADEDPRDETVLAGLFHDLLEDTDATEEEILDIAGPEVLEAVRLLTKVGDKSPEKYIADILENPIAKAVKNADRIDNLTEACSSSDEAFVRRYLQDTKEHYFGRFSSNLDDVYKRFKRIVEGFNDSTDMI